MDVQENFFHLQAAEFLGHTEWKPGSVPGFFLSNVPDWKTPYHVIAKMKKPGTLTGFSLLLARRSSEQAPYEPAFTLRSGRRRFSYADIEVCHRFVDRQ
jgi:hypothetical protein